MQGVENEEKQPHNHTLNDCEEVGHGRGGARGGRLLANALGDGRSTSSNQ